MAGDWLKVEVVTPDKEEVVQIATALGIDQDAAFGKCFRLWAWADQHSVNGNALRVTGTFLDRITNCPGFAAALRQVGWLEGRDAALLLPNFARHNGHTAKSRALTKKRVENHRGGDCNAPPVTPALPEKEKSRLKPSREAASEDGLKFAEWFHGLLPPGQKQESEWREKWAHCYDDLLRLDARTKTEIATVCKWARGDAFWRGQFFSPTKLRKRDKDGVLYFDVFAAKAKAPSVGPGRVNINSPDHKVC